MKSGADVWICRNCRSINPLRSGRCYHCSTPREVGAAKPEELSITAHDASQVPTGTFRSSRMLAVAVSVLTVVFILTTLFALWTLVDVSGLQADRLLAEADALWAERLPLMALAPLTAIAALLAYAGWIRRVVANLPTLGLGYSRVSPTWAFFEPLIPGFNVYGLLARLSEVIKKLGGHRTAIPLLGFAVFVATIPTVIALYVYRATLSLGSGSGYLHGGAITLLVISEFVAVSFVIVLVVIWQVEGLVRAAHDRLRNPARPRAAAALHP